MGDVAQPRNDPVFWNKIEIPWVNQGIVLNLEGALTDDFSNISKRVLFNHRSLFESINRDWKVAVSMANNHISDLPEDISKTISFLEGQRIEPFGWGENLQAAGKSVGLEDKGREVRLLGFGWNVIGCRPATVDHSGVNPLIEEHVLSCVERERAIHPDACIVCVMHWNYEMELYPLPAQRRVAFRAIDEGADAIIGHHPHRINGMEYYLEKPIYYSIGNFWLPQGVFFGGKLYFDSSARLELALEYHPDGDDLAHWFEYSPSEREIRYIESECTRDSKRLNSISEFAGLSDTDYLEFFRENRVKRVGLPIYHDFCGSWSNASRNAYVDCRHRLLVLSEELGIRRQMKNWLRD